MRKIAAVNWKVMRGPALAILIVLGLGLAAFGTSKYTAPEVVTWNPGGRLDEFFIDLAELRASGRRVVIDGPCLSACTFITGLIPPERVCVTPYGFLGFHSAWVMGGMGPRHSSEGTRLAWQTYPAHVRQMLIDRGWDGDPEDHRENPRGNEHHEFIYIRAPEIYQIWRPCS